MHEWVNGSSVFSCVFKRYISFYVLSEDFVGTFDWERDQMYLVESWNAENEGVYKWMCMYLWIRFEFMRELNASVGVWLMHAWCLRKMPLRIELKCLMHSCEDWWWGDVMMIRRMFVHKATFIHGKTWHA